jgi:hypothetical protein
MDTNTTPRKPRRARLTALVAGGLLLGGAAAGVTGASAATAESSSGSSSSSTSTPSGAPSGAPQQGSAAVRSDEQVVTGAKAETLKAAALKAVPGGTVIRVETDAGDGAYEAHMTKSDGTRVTVKFDKDYAVTAVEAGMGTGDPHDDGDGRGGHGPSGGRSGEGV